MLSGLAVGGFYCLDSVFPATRSGPPLGDLLETHYGCAAVQLSSN